MPRTGPSIVEPLKFDLSHAAQHPLNFMLNEKSPKVRRGGKRVTTPRGDTINYYPWGLEESVKQGPTPVFYLLRYCFPVTDVDYIVAYCLDHLLDDIHRLMTGRDFGGKVTDLVAKHWPATMTLLQRSEDWKPATPTLIKIVTAGEQWAVASTFTSSTTSDELIVPDQIMVELTDWAMRALGETMHGAARIPGLIEVLGGPDYLARRLEDAATATGLGSDIADMVSKFVR